MESKTRISPLQKLTATWHVVAVLAVMLTKLMRRFEDGYAAGAHAQARQLQVIVRAAHMMLMQDIAEAAEETQPSTEDDTHALAHLLFIAASLLVIHRVLENVLARGLRGAALWQVSARQYYSQVVSMVPERSHYGAPLLDPG